VLLRDDFKSAVETIESALDTFASVPARRRFVVLGAASEFEERQTQLYLRLGERAARVSSRVLSIANSEALARGARRALPAAAVTEHHGVHELARTLAAELEPGDVVLIKGRTDQKLGRVAHLLAGRDVRCSLLRCPARGLLCERCPRL
jgi:UDP-N-acetylmuramyl pentapeptide synthase